MTKAGLQMILGAGSLCWIVLMGACVDEATRSDDKGDVASQQAAVGPPFITHLDLNNPADNLTALLKTRGSLDPTKETVYYFYGTVSSYVNETSLSVPPPPAPPIPVAPRSNKLLFLFEGYNIARIVPETFGYRLLSREIAVYRDPVTRQILSCWMNPYNGRLVKVVHVANNPFNIPFFAASWRPLPTLEYNGRVQITSDTLLANVSPLPLPTYGLYSTGNIYQAAELFNFGVNRFELDLNTLDSVRAEVTWTRISDWLPWMMMGDTADTNLLNGLLLYHARSFKLSGGFEALPTELKDFVVANYPADYQHAPELTVPLPPNQNSWTVFRGILNANPSYDPLCP
jgi:hypothetical protein